MSAPFFLSEFREMADRVEARLLKGSLKVKYSDWIAQNTTLKGSPFSFLNHEFQIDIVDYEGEEMVCMKCSQAGVSEAEVRRMLAKLAIHQGLTAIYSLPNSKFAIKFAQGRIDPVVDGSKRLSELNWKRSNSGELKQFGASSLYPVGASIESQAISIPADVLVQDEFDFGTPEILALLSSRLRHAKNGGETRKFSTPTLPGFGIHKAYSSSTQALYLCKCERCETWVEVDFSRDVMIPGYDGAFAEFEKEMLEDPSISWRDAVLLCPNPSCRKPIDRSLANPKRREWVHRWTSASAAGFHVRPTDIIAYNPTVSVLKQLKLYENRMHYDNFVLGVTYASDATEVNLETVKRNTTETEAMRGQGLCMGLDVGKKLYITIGTKEDKRYKFVRFLSIDVTDEEDTAREIVSVFRQYGCVQLVMDSQPDYSLVMAVRRLLGEAVLASVYVKGNMKKPSYWELSGTSDSAVNIQRDRALTNLVTAINRGKVRFCKADNADTVRSHLQGMKMSYEMDAEGNKAGRWKKLDRMDHYFHSSLYCKAAIDIAYPEGEELEDSVVPVSVSPVSIGKKPVDTTSTVAQALRSMGLGAALGLGPLR